LAGTKRVAYLDALRILAFFLVVVNHTNHLFRELAPSPSWFVSLAAFFIDRPAVLLYMMISGATLLGRGEPPSKSLKRAGRMAAILVAFTFLYRFVFNLQILHMTAGDFLGFLKNLPENPAPVHLWYLYFNITLMLMVPILNRLADRELLRYVLPLTLIPMGVYPLLQYYASFTITERAYIPMITVFAGLVLAGWAYHNGKKPPRPAALLAVYAALLAFQVVATYIEYRRGSETWLFLDNRRMITVAVSAICVFLLVKRLFERFPPPERAARWISRAGSCTFAAYLLHMAIIQRTGAVSARLLEMPHPLLGVLLYELLIFAASLCLAALVRLIPGMKKIL
jgi:surface polysaccharide O-acyltransferase-like enzyme